MNEKQLEIAIMHFILDRAKEDFRSELIEELTDGGERKRIPYFLKEFERNKELAFYFFRAGWKSKDAFMQAKEMLP